MYRDSAKIELGVFESWKSWKETGRVCAVQIDQFEREKLESLSLDDIFDDMRAKMLEFEICLVNSGNAGVGVVVALHGKEEAVERSAQVIGVENWSDEIVWIARSGEFGASRECSFFQLELEEFCHCSCESCRLSSLFLFVSKLAIFVVNREIEIVVHSRNCVPVVVFLWQRLGGEGDVEAGVDDSVFVRFENDSQNCAGRCLRVSFSPSAVSVEQVVSVGSVEDVNLVVGATAEAGVFEPEVGEIGADLVTFGAVDCNSVVLAGLVSSAAVGVGWEGPGIGELIGGESDGDSLVDIWVPDTIFWVRSVE